MTVETQSVIVIRSVKNSMKQEKKRSIFSFGKYPHPPLGRSSKIASGLDLKGQKF